MPIVEPKIEWTEVELTRLAELYSYLEIAKYALNQGDAYFYLYDHEESVSIRLMKCHDAVPMQDIYVIAYIKWSGIIKTVAYLSFEVAIAKFLVMAREYCIAN